MTATNNESTTKNPMAPIRPEYERRMVAVRQQFEADGDGVGAVAARSALVDELVQKVWAAEIEADRSLASEVGLAAVGGYGRAQLFPFSDVDLLFCVDKSAVANAKNAIRKVSQVLWDCGMQVSATTRTPGECDRLQPGNPEFALSLLDARPLAGDPAMLSRLNESVAKLMSKDCKSLRSELAELTRDRYTKYGNTLFHLEPNIKDCPGGLRDVNVCQWLRRLNSNGSRAGDAGDFFEATGFITAVRCFLHYRHDRDDNTLDWAAQDAAARQGIGLGQRVGLREGVDGAYWMRVYFRFARVVERGAMRELENAGMRLREDVSPKRVKLPGGSGLRWKDKRLDLEEQTANGWDASHDAEVVLRAFELMAETGVRLASASEERISDAVPVLSATLEEGPGLWRRLATILAGAHAAAALRTMHALGVLELILPEFHGIDALVIRDAYHRYTVDEHTFVLIETLHKLKDDSGKNAPEWRTKLGAMIRELQSPELLYLAALLHDTGKGRASGNHAAASAEMARGVLKRLEMDPYESALVLRLIENHLEMSAALRRDIFDAETVRAFAAKVQTHETLRMLTLFTYADIAAVHPDAMTPWKAENLWRLSMATSNQLDRHVDEERVQARGRIASGRGPTQSTEDKITRMMALVPGRQVDVERFLEGFPERYVRTRTPETMLLHLRMTERFDEEPFQIAFQHGDTVSEITLVTQDRPRLFAGMAAALAAWGMNVVTADAFANGTGLIVDSFRFTDTFRTLELNESERDRFVVSVRDLVAGKASLERMLSGRRRGKKAVPRVRVETSVEFEDEASSSSTLLQVVAQDVPGLLRAISATVSEMGYNVEVALIDTEGETAIDVFYLTSKGERLNEDEKLELRTALVGAIEQNAV